MTQLPLAGVRVLELGNYIAGPTAGRLLADFGAEVIKVERPGRGDELRNWRLHAGDTSMLFRTINRNKKSVVLDLKTPDGRAAVLDLVGHCDVVIENFRPGTLEAWGLGPDRLEEANPDVVLARISAFGQTGPLAQRPGFAAVAEAFGGVAGARRRGRPAAVAGRGVDRRLDRRALRGVRRADRIVRTRTGKGTAATDGWSMSHSTNPFSR